MSLTPAQLNPMPLEPETGTCATLLGAAATVEIVATAAHSLARPRDVNFHPQTGHLWVRYSPPPRPPFHTLLSPHTLALSPPQRRTVASLHCVEGVVRAEPPRRRLARAVYCRWWQATYTHG
jgi:hypothetical protein